MIFTVAFRLLLPGDMQVLLEGGGVSTADDTLTVADPAVVAAAAPSPTKAPTGPRRGLRVREPSKRLSSAEWAV